MQEDERIRLAELALQVPRRQQENDKAKDAHQVELKRAPRCEDCDKPVSRKLKEKEKAWHAARLKLSEALAARGRLRQLGVDKETRMALAQAEAKAREAERVHGLAVMHVRDCEETLRAVKRAGDKFAPEELEDAQANLKDARAAARETTGDMERAQQRADELALAVEGRMEELLQVPARSEG